jgi:hypothetical protein
VNFSLRPLISSRPGRVLAWLAWLLLVASPLQGAPSSDQAGMPHHVHAAVVDGGHGHATPAAGHDCCVQAHGLSVPDACHCASTCSSTLPAIAIALLERLAPSAPLVAPSPVHAPHGVHDQLLRPPAV